MELHEFARHMDSLKNVYGDRAYPAEREKIIFSKIKWRSEKVWEESVKRLIADSMQPPLLTKISEMCSLVQREYPEISVDPYAGVRQQIKSKVQANSCQLCNGHGTILAYKKYMAFNQANYICTCLAGDMAWKLPENRHMRQYETHDPFWVILHNDPNKSEKFDMYKGFATEDVNLIQSEIAKIYYDHEIFYDPCYWVPKDWNQEAKRKFEKREIDVAKYKEEIKRYIEAFKKEGAKDDDPWWR